MEPFLNSRSLHFIIMFCAVFIGAVAIRWLAIQLRQKVNFIFRKKASDSNLITIKPRRFDPRQYFLAKKYPWNLSRSVYVVAKRLGLRATIRQGKQAINSPEGLRWKRFVDLLEEQAQGKTFIGLSESGKPVYLDFKDRKTHLQVIGRTGSGKSAGVLRTMIAQDILNGHGVIIVDAKGSSDFRREVIGMAVEAGRQDDFRLLSLAHPRNSHAYNPVRIPKHVEPAQVADRLFTAISPSRQAVRDNYYLKQQAFCLRLMVRALAGLAEPFTIRDLYQWMLNPDLIDVVQAKTVDQSACTDLLGLQDRLGRSFSETMSGLVERMQCFASKDVLCQRSSLNQLQFDDVFENGRIVYCQLPTGAEPLLARDLARIIFQDIEFETSLREIGAGRSKQKFCAVYADEFYEFVYPDLIGAIGKARSGNVGWLIAHQSRGDLRQLGEAYWTGIWDNTAIKIILEQTDPDLGEWVSRSLGTRERIKSTWRSKNGDPTANAEGSHRNAEQFRFNPNNLRSLAHLGQGFLVNRKDFIGLNFGLFEPPQADILIPRPVEAVEDSAFIHGNKNQEHSFEREQSVPGY